MSETQLSSYEDVPYESKPLYPTHPDCLATVATLMGMKPAPVDRCRVLELGCATGGNLVPMAMALPDSRFVGIDLSPRQIDDGRALVARLGLKNIDLRAVSITDVDDSFGEFDFILCHGVYSWVPPAVQDKILEICRRNLSPHGVAYISYNTYPGWHLRASVREMMSFHVKRFTDPKVRVGQARAFLDFLIGSLPNSDSTYHRLLKEEADVLRPAADFYLYHEHLEDANEPLYFWQFMERAAAKELQYLGESWFHTRLDNIPPEARETLQELSEDLLQLEQYLDFLHNRTFRRTLLCHAGVTLDRAPKPEVLRTFHVTGLVKPKSERPDVDSAAVEAFAVDNGTTASTNDPVVKAALTALYESWPRALSFPALWSLVRDRLPSLAKQQPRFLEVGDQALAADMMRCYLANLVALHVHPPRIKLEMDERPQASPLARLQAASTSRVTNLRHRLVELADLDRILLPAMDGTRDRAALLDVLVELAAKGTISLEKDGAPVQDAGLARELLSESLEHSLMRLARNALLV